MTLNEGFMNTKKVYLNTQVLYRPLYLMSYIAVNNEAKARRLERYLKTGSGKAILKKRILMDEALA